MALSLAEIEAYWILAGGRPTAAPTAAAIAMAESRGNAGVIQQGQPYATTGWGLWQITPGNSVPSAGTNNSLLSPLANAKAAIVKSKNGTDWTQWTTYANGHGPYRSWLSQAQALLPHVQADIKGLTPPSGDAGLGIPGLDQAAGGIVSGLNTVSGALSGVESVGQSLAKIVGFLTNPTNWLRIGEVIAGLILIMMGLRSLTGFSIPTPVGAGRRVATSAGLGEIIR